MQFVRLWNLEKDRWRYAGIRMPLDVDSPVAKNWAEDIKNGNLTPFPDHVQDPDKAKPSIIPENILNLVSPAQGIRDREIEAKRLFHGSNRFFMDRTGRVLKPEKLAKNQVALKEGSVLQILVTRISEEGLTLEETGYKSEKSLVDDFGKLGYQLEIKGNKYHLCQN